MNHESQKSQKKVKYRSEIETGNGCWCGLAPSEKLKKLVKVILEKENKNTSVLKRNKQKLLKLAFVHVYIDYLDY